MIKSEIVKSSIFLFLKNLNFKTSCCNLKIEVRQQNCVWLFYYCNFEGNYDVLKSKVLCILLNKNIKFNENKAKPKMENPTHSCREWGTLCFSSYKNCKLKVKLRWVGARERKKEGIFCTVYFLRRIIFFISMYSVLNTLSEYTYFYKQKTLLHTLFCLFLKLSKAFSVSLNAKETSRSICRANQLAYFDMMATLEFNKLTPGKYINCWIHVSREIITSRNASC